MLDHGIKGAFTRLQRYTLASAMERHRIRIDLKLDYGELFRLVLGKELT
jgi:hypothetical protein